MRAFPLVLIVCGLAVVSAPAQKKSRKEKKEELTQTLQLPKELPAWISGDTRHLSFYVTPLSAKGLLSAQIREALRALSHETGSDTVLKIRAFVAGSGDLRRVRDLVSEIFTDRHQPLPVLSLVRAGGLPLEGAQVVLEVTASSRKEVNPHGLVFLSAQPATSANPLEPAGPLATQSLARLRKALEEAGSEPEDVIRVSCFLSSLEGLAAIRQAVATEYPRAAQNYVQTQRAPGQAIAACESVARARTDAPRLAVRPGAATGEAGLSQAALTGAPHLVLTGTQVSFGFEEKDARLAFERLVKGLEQAGVSARDVVFVHYYPLSLGIAAQVRKVRTEFFDPAHPPAGSMLIFEGLPSMDAGFAIDVVAAKD